MRPEINLLFLVVKIKTMKKIVLILEKGINLHQFYLLDQIMWSSSFKHKYPDNCVSLIVSFS